MSEPLPIPLSDLTPDRIALLQRERSPILVQHPNGEEVPAVGLFPQTTAVCLACLPHVTEEEQGSLRRNFFF